MAQRLRISLAISADDYLLYYKEGDVTQVYARAEDGRSVRFPANILRPFLKHEGIYGRFELLYDDHHRLKDIVQLEE